MTKTKSTGKNRKGKARKGSGKGRNQNTKVREFLPYPDFPLSPHFASGRWYKTMRANGQTKGKRYYFGKLGDGWEAAKKLYDHQKDDIAAGRKPTSLPEDGEPVGLTVRALVNHFLTAKQRKLDASEIKLLTFDEYYKTGARLIDEFGRDRLLIHLAPTDFEAMRAKMAKTMGAVRLGNEIQRVRSFFKYGLESGLMEKPMRYGPEFVKPSKSVIRKNRHSRPAKMYQPKEIKKMIKKARPQLKAMILLGINCGWGNTDVAELQQKHVDLKRGVADFPRPKTGIERRATLWPETIKAIRAVLKDRPNAKQEADADCVFLTVFGERWVRTKAPGSRAEVDGKAVTTDSVGLEFRKLLRSLGIPRDGRGFYALRHTFETIAGQTKDQPAVDRIMGHEAENMATRYREWLKDAAENKRLRAVTDHVRMWLR